MRDPAPIDWSDLVRARARRERCDLPLDVVDELAGHLADVYASARHDGRSEDDAREQALRVLAAASFGEVARRPRARARRSGDAWPALARDVRFALRRLRRAPGFTLTALVTLAIGIGANTAMFTLLHAVLLQSLPVAHASRLYKLGDEYRCCTFETIQGSWSVFSYPFYRELRDELPGVEELAAMQTLRPALSVRRPGSTAAAESFAGEFVSGNYFTTLGVAPMAGRLLEPGDDRQGARAVAVASYGAWERYGFDRSAVGQPITINGVSLTLVGVAPPAFFGDRLDTHPPDFWLPLSLEPTFTREGSLLEETAAGWLYVVARLGPNAEPGRLEAQITTALRRYLREPGHLNQRDELALVDAQVVRLVPGSGGINAMKDEYQQGLYLLLAVAAAVLLIACANLANLLLARGAGERARTAVELAMGASRGQIARRQLTESVILSLAGGAAGLLTAVYGSRAILLIAFRGAPRAPIAASPSIPILLFTFIVALATGVLFGAGPAWLAARSDPADALRGSPRIVATEARPQRSLVVLQAALTLALVTVAALLTQSLRNLGRLPLGFEPSGRLVVQIDPQSAGYTPSSLPLLYRRIDDRLAQLRGVDGESLALYTVQQTENIWGARVYLDNGGGPWRSLFDRVGPGYFDAMGTPIVDGRAFDAHDTADSRRVAVISEAFARQYFPGARPIGRHFGRNDAGHAQDYEIVGVAKDAMYEDGARAIRPMFFVPLTQSVAFTGVIPNKIEESSHYAGTIVMHVRGEPGAMEPAVRAALASIDPNLPPTSITSLGELVATTASRHTLLARLSDAFGIIALVLAAVGLYGVTAYRVARRTGEIGLRMALGATRGNIATLVVRGALSPTALGLVAGVPLALAAAAALRHQLIGVSPFDVAALILSAVLVCACALGAVALPARRATAIAPMQALRTD